MKQYMRLSSNHVCHDIVKIKGKYYYNCIRAVGSFKKISLSDDQCVNCSLICKNCLRKRKGVKHGN